MMKKLPVENMRLHMTKKKIYKYKSWTEVQKHPTEFNNFSETEKLHVLPATDHKGKKFSVKQRSGKLRK